MTRLSRSTARAGVMPAMAVILAIGMAATAAAQMGPRSRAHTTLQSDGAPDRLPATSQAPGTQSVTATVEGDQRIIIASGIPGHAVGRFPNSGNPHSIRAQNYRITLAATPQKADRTTPARGYPFGIALNGVVFDPGAAEWYQGRPGPWQYEPLSGAVPLGLDANNAHVQPNGAYHYQGLPEGLMAQLGVSRDTHSPLIGWAADGFPIYALYGHLDRADPASPIIEHSSGYRLKQGRREPVEARGRFADAPTPGGYYDGTFVADYAYVEGQGTLDECNGTFTVTPDHPEGTYAYFLTRDWPVIPRCFAGTPSESFTAMRPARAGGRDGNRDGNRPARPGGPRDGDRFGRPPQRF
ncbi:YHYH protein [Pyruvatibacter mobilis]|uniref:YHYH protein n=1 Tax=Pyruvatibacter mobilis TaxID=1712261 RepID=UPI003D09746C